MKIQFFSHTENWGNIIQYPIIKNTQLQSNWA